jgi:hypothetical protein
MKLRNVNTLPQRPQVLLQSKSRSVRTISRFPTVVPHGLPLLKLFFWRSETGVKASHPPAGGRCVHSRKLKATSFRKEKREKEETWTRKARWAALSLFVGHGYYLLNFPATRGVPKGRGCPKSPGSLFLPRGPKTLLLGSGPGARIDPDSALGERFPIQNDPWPVKTLLPRGLASVPRQELSVAGSCAR